MLGAGEEAQFVAYLFSMDNALVLIPRTTSTRCGSPDLRFQHWRSGGRRSRRLTSSLATYGLRRWSYMTLCFKNQNCKCCSSEGKDILIIGNQEIPQSHCTTRDLLEKTQEGDCLCLGEKRQRTEQETGFI